MNPRLFFWALTSALAGFLFGFDTVVISGAEKTIEELWGLTPFMHGLCTSAALWGTLIGSLLGGFPTEHYGRRKTLIAIGFLYFISAIGSGIAPEEYSFMLARFIGGLGVGVATVTSPLYISEMSPPKNRGLLAGLFQFNIVFGILIAFVSNYLIGKYVVDDLAWRLMLGVEAVPALIYMVMCVTLPESPRWLITHQGDKAAAKEIFMQISPNGDEIEIDELIAQVEESGKPSASGSGINFNKLSIPITLAFLIAFFNQASGINAVLYFAKRIFEMAGLGDDAASLQSVGLGVTNLIFTFVGLYLIDKLGRKTLLIIGSFGYIGSLGLCAASFYFGWTSIVPYAVFAFIGSHAVGQGAVIWVFISEIFPNKSRAFGQSLGSGTHWLFAALLTFVFPMMAEAIEPYGIFAIFCGFMVLQLIWVLAMVPETKGVPLEELEEKLGTRDV